MATKKYIKAFQRFKLQVADFHKEHELMKEDTEEEIVNLSYSKDLEIFIRDMDNLLVQTENIELPDVNNY